MSEELFISTESDKDARYRALLPQVRSLMAGEPDAIAKMANLAAALCQTFHFFWVGFYRVVEGEKGEELVLGPFQGPIACTRIQRGRGVCGTAWATRQTVVVPDVEQFPGHIACNSASRSEIVVPVFREGRIVAVLDIDSENLRAFDQVDAEYLERMAAYLFEEMS